MDNLTTPMPEIKPL